MQKSLTVGELRKLIEGLPDDLEVKFSSDTAENEEIIIESARRVQYKSDYWGDVDYFDIYGNYKDDESDEV